MILSSGPSSRVPAAWIHDPDALSRGQLKVPSWPPRTCILMEHINYHKHHIDLPIPIGQLFIVTTPRRLEMRTIGGKSRNR